MACCVTRRLVMQWDGPLCNGMARCITGVQECNQTGVGHRCLEHIYLEVHM